MHLCFHLHVCMYDVFCLQEHGESSNICSQTIYYDVFPFVIMPFHHLAVRLCRNIPGALYGGFLIVGV